jgi:hypothetical protein
MIKSKSFKIGLVFAGFAVIAGVYFLKPKINTNENQKTLESRRQDVNKIRVAGESEAVAPATMAPVAKMNLPKYSPKYSEELLKRFNSSVNLREFVEYAIQHPEMGGNYYALQALNQCLTLTRGVPFYSEVQSAVISGESDEKYRARSKAADLLRSQCSGFTADEISDSRIKKVFSDGVNGNDPLLKSTLKFSESLGNFAATGETLKARKEALGAILQTQDPMVLKDIGPRISMQIDPESGRRGYWYGESFYPLNSDIDVGLAIYLLPCSFGLKCDAGEFDMALRCASGVECSDGRYAHVQNMLKDKSGSYEKVLALTKNMTESIQAQKVAHFFR